MSELRGAKSQAPEHRDLAVPPLWDKIRWRSICPFNTGRKTC